MKPQATFFIEEIKVTHFNEPRDTDGDTFIVTLISFCERHDGSIEVMFADKRTPMDYESLVGFKHPFVALRNIFDAINAITTAYPNEKFWYRAHGKRASIYRRYTNIDMRI